MSGSLITDEMVEAVTRSLHPGLFEDDGLLHPALALSGQWQARRKVRAALEAIEPMLGKLIGDAQASEGDLMREAGYRAGYEAGKKYQLDLERWCA